MIAELSKNRVVDFKHEKFSDALMEEMIPLWQEHYEEIALYKDIPLSPALSIYASAEQKGMLRIFTARYEDRLVGYEIFFIHQHPHYESALEAVQDCLFLSLETRHGLIGYQFIKWVDSELAATDAQVIFRCVSNMKNYGSLLVRMGYQKHDVVFSKRVK